MVFLIISDTVFTKLSLEHGHLFMGDTIFVKVNLVDNSFLLQIPGQVSHLWKSGLLECTHIVFFQSATVTC